MSITPALLMSRSGLAGVPAGEDHLGAPPGQDAGGLQAQPGVGAGDDGRAPGQIGDVGLGPVPLIDGWLLSHRDRPTFRVTRCESH
jgi:hypothetical protein